MKTKLLAILASITTILLCCPAQLDKQMHTPSILELENRLTKAERENDQQSLHNLLADDFFGVSSRGDKLDKNGFIQSFNAQLTFNSLEIEDLEIKFLENTAWVSGKSVYQIEVQGHKIDGSARYIDTWIRQESGWKLQSASITPILTNGPSSPQN